MTKNQDFKNVDELIHELREKVLTRGDFAEILNLLIEDFQQNGDEWDNNVLLHYLEAMSAWLGDAEAYYASRKVEVDLDTPSWRVLSDILLAARVYE